MAISIKLHADLYSAFGKISNYSVVSPVDQYNNLLDWAE